MNQETLALLSLMSLLLGFLLIGWYTEKVPNPLLRSTSKHRRKGKPRAMNQAAVDKALAFLAVDPNDGVGPECVTFPCVECGRDAPPLTFEECGMSNIDGGFVLVAVCRRCGGGLVSKIYKPSAAAGFIAKGARQEYPPLVMFRHELNATDCVVETVRADGWRLTS